MAKRKGLSKRQRFAVFKRDLFTCQYCGQKPPEVILEADHMVPLAAGGEDHERNMVTACQDCNRGKAAIPLDVIPTSLGTQVQDRQDRADQTRAYNRFLLKLRNEEMASIRRLAEHWFELAQWKQNASTFPQDRINSLRTFLKRLPEMEVVDSIDVAFGRKPAAQYSDGTTWSYFCGICWKKIKGGQQ